ncbi:MAG: amino acid adenylation domain-containing protein [Anaeromyxobacteraceae bacterium]
MVSASHHPLGTLVSILRERAARSPGALAFRMLADGEEEAAVLTYGELDLRARHLAARLAAAGARGERALLLHPPGLEYVVAIFGCAYAGVVAVPAYPPRFNRPMLRLRALVADAGARFALTTSAVLRRIERQLPTEPELARLTWLTSEEAAEDAAPPAPTSAAAAPGDLALLQYTSGSTSTPKGVMLTHAHLARNAALLVERLRLTPADHLVSWLPPYHDMGLVAGIVVPVLAGLPATHMTPGAFLQRPARWLQAVSRHRATITGGPDFAWDQCARRVSDADLAGLDLSSLRIAFSGAERVRPATLDRFAARFAPAGFRAEAFCPCYGLAEATLGVSFHVSGTPGRRERVDARALGEGRAEPSREGAPAVELVASGTPLDDFEVRAVDPATKAVLPDGEVGELWVRGPSLAAGYFGNAPLTEALFGAVPAGRDGRWLRTGDLGYLRGGAVFVSGRLKELVVLRGANHHPEDLELAALAAHGRLRPGAAIAFADEGEGEERLVIALEVDDPRDAPAEEIVRAVRGAVGDAHELTVHEVVLLPPGGLPRTSSGKLQRGSCRELWRAGALSPIAATAQTARAAPDALLAAVQAAAAEVLGVARVEADDDFFALGGHSLLATQLVSRLAAAHGVDLPLRAVFEAPTPRALAARVAAAPRAPAAPPVPRVDRGGPLALTFSQERMWYLHTLDTGGSAYNVGGAIELTGRLDLGVLGRALEHVVREHEVLRTTYPAPGGVPTPRIHPPDSDAARPRLAYADLALADDPTAEAHRQAEALAGTPFDLANGPLFRTRLLRTGADRHVLAVSLAHVVADGWALGVLLSDLLDAYQALLACRPPRPAGPIQVVDLAAWQRAALDGPAVAREVAFWRRTLAGAPVLELPRLRAGPGVPGGELEPIGITPALLERVRALAREQNATPFMVVLAAFQVLLARITGQHDVVLGVPVAQRTALASERVIGSLVNTLPLRGQVDLDATFAAHLGGVREATLEAYAHQALPFERLVVELGVERRPGRSPLFSVMFDHQNSPMPARGVEGLTLRPITYSRRASQFDLSLLFFDTELGHLAGFEYATERIDRDAARLLARELVHLLDAVTADPLAQLSRLPLLDAAARREILAVNGPYCPGSPPEERVIRRFEAQAARTPDRVAVSDEAGATTYRALDRAASALAVRLAAAGAGPGKRVAVCLDRSRAIAVALLGVMKTGAAYVPLDPRYPAERIGWTFEDAAPVAVVTEPAVRARLPLLPGLAEVLLDPAALDAGGHAEPARGPDRSAPGDVAYVIYTSGSTGRPKGVEVTDRGLSNFLTAMQHEPGLSAADRLLSVTTISFDIAGLELFLPLVTGASVHLVSSDVAADPIRLAHALRETGATVMQATPATWRMLVQSGWAGDPRLKVLSGGEALSRELAAALLARGAAVWNLYGPTETTIWSTLERVRPGDGPVPVGHPVRHNRIYVLDRHLEPVPFGAPGEICIGGAGVAAGYLGRPELTAERFPPDPFAGPGARMYRTGDLGVLRPDGTLEYLGRLDQQVKIRGHRVEPGEIEAVLKRHPGVRQVVVSPRPGPDHELRLVAYLVPEPGAAAPERGALRDLCRRELPEHMVPSFFVPLDALPLTPNGKLDRRAMPAPLEAHAGGSVARVPPRDALEARLARIWSEVLAAPVEDVTDDFFDLGGHSLLAARLFARVEAETGVALPISALLEAPTVERLAGLLRRAAGPEARGEPPLPSFDHLLAIRGGGHRAPVFCVHGAGGHVLNLVEVARHLAPDRPFYGLQARGTDGHSRPLGSVGEMAAIYLEEIRRVWPQGPYHLAGYCGGALVAYEIAQRLAAEGREVSTLALIDIARPGLPPGPGRLERWGRAAASRSPLALFARAAEKLGARLRRGLLSLRLAWHGARGRIPPELRDPWLTRAFLRASEAYRPGRYPGPISVFRARDSAFPASAGPDLGWGAVTGGVAVYEVPGDHHSLTRGTNADVLGTMLEACVRAAEASPPGERATG